MLKLKKLDLITVELPGGVTITSTPITAPDMEVATNSARRRLGQTADAAAAYQRYGITPPAGGVEAEDLTNVFGVSETFLAIELGIRHIQSWTGVGTDADDDTPAEKNDGNIVLLFNAWIGGTEPTEGPTYGRTWLRRMLAKSTLEKGAGKGSAASPGTSTAEAASTASNAVRPKTPAPPAEA